MLFYSFYKLKDMNVLMKTNNIPKETNFLEQKQFSFPHTKYFYGGYGQVLVWEGVRGHKKFGNHWSRQSMYLMSTLIRKNSKTRMFCNRVNLFIIKVDSSPLLLVPNIHVFKLVHYLWNSPEVNLDAQCILVQVLKAQKKSLLCIKK